MSQILNMVSRILMCNTCFFSVCSFVFAFLNLSNGFLPMLFVIKFALGTPNKEFFNNKGLPWLCFVNCFDPKYYDPSLRLP